MSNVFFHSEGCGFFDTYFSNPFSVTVSPSSSRNSLKAGECSLLQNISSSVVWGKIRENNNSQTFSAAVNECLCTCPNF